MLFELINSARSPRVVSSLRGQVAIPPQHEIKDTNKRVDLSDNTAITIRRLEAKGSELHIKALDADGEAVLERAEAAPVRKDKHFNMIGNPPGHRVDTVLEDLVEADVIKDEIADASAPGVYSLEHVEAAMRGAGLAPLVATDAPPLAKKRAPTRGRKLAERAAKKPGSRVRLSKGG